MKKSYKNFAVLGLGRLGMSVALTLANGDVDVIVVDESKEKIESISNQVTKAVIGDVTDINVLKSLNISECDVVLVCIGTNLEASLVTCTILKELGVKYIIAKAKSKEHKFILEKIGVDKVVLPEAEIGASIAINLLNSNKLSYVDYNTDYTIAELEPKEEWIGKNLITLNLRRNEGINVIAIKKKNDPSSVNVSPNPEYIIKKDDIIVAISESTKTKFE